MASLTAPEVTSSATASNTTLVGYFSNSDSAHSAFEALQQAGFSSDQLGIAASDDSRSSTATAGTSHSAHSKSGEPSVWDKVKNFFDGGNTAEPYAGETTGNALDNREITTGGYNFRDSLTDLSVPDEHSRYFGHKFDRSGGTVITVTAGGRAEEARAILTQYGADLGEDASSYDYPETASSANADLTTERNIRLYGEVLRVQKNRVSAGEVRLRKEVITETQTVQVPVTREELVIERVAATGDQPATGATFAGEEIRIPLSEEVASVDKQAVLREEVRVGKRDVTEVDTFDETVRREELKVEDSTESTR